MYFSNHFPIFFVQQFATALNYCLLTFLITLTYDAEQVDDHLQRGSRGFLHDSFGVMSEEDELLKVEPIQPTSAQQSNEETQLEVTDTDSNECIPPTSAIAGEIENTVQHDSTEPTGITSDHVYGILQFTL